MGDGMWSVYIKKKALKDLEKLPEKVQDLFAELKADLEFQGPEQPSWPNYSKLGADKYHCHLNYSYVACWIAEKKAIKIEVYYVGSREKASY